MARSAGRTRPVIKDVAKLAGVSAPTVSRYLNGTVNVTEDKRERIAKAIKELGYTVKYKFFRSTYYNKGYQGKINGSGLTYVNTAGTKGTRYYYKARVMVYDEDGSLAAYTRLEQCTYACRVWTKG